MFQQKISKSKVIKCFGLSFFSLVIGVFIYLEASGGFIRNYLPDALWSFAFVCALYPFTNSTLVSIFIAVVLGTFYELMQLFGMVAGTFDWFDILFYVMGSCGLFLQKIKIFGRQTVEE